MLFTARCFECHWGMTCLDHLMGDAMRKHLKRCKGPVIALVPDNPNITMTV